MHSYLLLHVEDEDRTLILCIKCGLLKDINEQFDFIRFPCEHRLKLVASHGCLKHKKLLNPFWRIMVKALVGPNELKNGKVYTETYECHCGEEVRIINLEIDGSKEYSIRKVPIWSHKTCKQLLMNKVLK